MTRTCVIRLFLSLWLIGYSLPGYTQMPDAPARTEGDGPYAQLIIRGVTLINGNGAPPIGPVDVVIEQNRIRQVQVVGSPGAPIPAAARPRLKPGGREIQAEGMYLLPGFVDMHGHIGGLEQGTTPEYVFKLWMAHGVTTVREPGSFNGMEWTLRHRDRSAANEITAPRIKAYIGFGMGADAEIYTPAAARSWVQYISAQGADGIKFFGARTDIMAAALEEARLRGLRSACHHAQMNVAWLNVVQSASMGLTTMEHWYGLPEAMLATGTIQQYPVDYNYQNEQHRFGEAGRLWMQAAPPGSPQWEAVIDTLLRLDFTLDPTFNIYEANRDLMRVRTAEWHPVYTLPSLWAYFQPSRTAHGSHWHSWGTEQETDWRQNYQLWMTFVNAYKNRGGRVTTGSDSGYLFQLYGFAYIRELELLREAGFHPLEVIRAATLHGAEGLGMEQEIGTIEPGKLADMILVAENPLADLKVLYGTGAIRLSSRNEVTRSRGIVYTIKDGIVYDAEALLQDVADMVTKAKSRTAAELKQPGQ